MKVILSVDAIKHPLTGIGRYTLELARHLGQLPGIEQLRYMSGRHLSPACPDYGNEPAPLSEPERSLKNSLRSKVRELFDSELSRKYEMRTKARKVYSRIFTSQPVIDSYRAVSSVLKWNALRDHKDSIYHGTNYYLPVFSGPCIATYHDLSVFTMQHYHPPERVRYMHKELVLTMKRADMLLTDSNYVRHEISSYFNYPLEKIRAVPLAASSEFRIYSKNEVSPVLGKLGLQAGSYSFYSGTIEPRKNIDILLDAYSMLPEPLRKRYPLVLAGYEGWHSEQLHARIDKAVRQGWACYLGYVSGEDLPYLFSGARLFVFPSLYEGFGLPVLEAMASGVPVVCSNASSLPEVAGNAAAMCDPSDVDTLKNLIEKGLEDDHWRSHATKEGLDLARQSSWKRCAEQTVEVYREMNG